MFVNECHIQIVIKIMEIMHDVRAFIHIVSVPVLRLHDMSHLVSRQQVLKHVVIYKSDI
jgi:hypothetical protein